MPQSSGSHCERKNPTCPTTCMIQGKTLLTLGLPWILLVTFRRVRTNLFQSLQEDCDLVLLFLKNVQRIKIEVITDDGTVKLAEFNRTVKGDSNGFKRESISLNREIVRTLEHEQWLQENTMNL